MSFRVSAGLLAGIVFFTAFPRPEPGELSACAVAPPANTMVSIADETAIIIWDSATQTEHFIRRAAFQTGAKDFGFLVPTPTKPTLTEADDHTFGTLAAITAPKIIKKTRDTKSDGCGLGCADKRADFALAPGAVTEPANVRVLEETRVAGYDAAVLEADNADALAKWLKEHDYEFSPTLKDWAKIYIDKEWKLTAFKIAKKAADKPDVSIQAVRMTFKTDQPFYPYREPISVNPGKSKASIGRLLRVYFLGDQKVEGAVGVTGKDWPAQTAWANNVDAANRETILGMLKITEKTPASWYLTEFEDRSAPRPASDDIYYRKAQQQLPVERPPHIQYVSNNFGGAVMFAAMGLCLAAPCVFRRLRRRAG